MKTGRVRKIIGAVFFICLIVFSSCDNNQKPEKSAKESPETMKGSDYAGDVDESAETDYVARKNKINENIDKQLSRINIERNSLKQNIDIATGLEKAQMQEQLERLNKRREQLQVYRENLNQGGLKELEIVENNLDSVLHEGVEAKSMDKSVRGEGTSLDGPDLNRTGTELDKRQQQIEEDLSNLEDTVDQ